MTEKEFEIKALEYEKRFEKIWEEIVRTVNQFVEEHPGKTMPSRMEKFADNLTLSGGWIIDRIAGKSSNPNSRLYRGSTTKKIRKILGYTY